MGEPRNLHAEETAALKADRDHPHRTPWYKVTIENSEGGKYELVFYSAVLTVDNEWQNGDSDDPASEKFLAYRTITVEGKPGASKIPK